MVGRWTIPNPKTQSLPKPYPVKTTTKNSEEIIRDHEIMLLVLEQFQI